MKNIVGIHFFEKNVRICICDDYNLYTDAMELPMSIRNANVLKDENAFRLSFEKIRAHMQENMGISDFDVILLIPDDYGIAEEKELLQMAERCDVHLIRTCRETAALAVYVNREFRAEDGITILSAVVTDDRVGIAKYDMGEEVRRLETVLVTEGTGSRGILNYISKRGPSLMFEHMPDAVFFTGSFNAGVNFEQAAVSGLGRSGIDIKMLDPSCLIEGLGFICGSVEDRPMAEGIRFSDVISVYPLGISVNQEILRFEAAPLTGECVCETIDHFPEPEGGTDRFILYEERCSVFKKVAEWFPSDENLGKLRRRPAEVGVEAGKSGTFSLVIQDKESGVSFAFSAKDAGDRKEAGKEESVSSFVEKILPIIDNLEYAAKYAKDDSNPYAQGIIQSYQKAVDILEQSGVKLISGEGEPFDFNLQNAVAHVADGDLPENTVKQVMQTGYMYQGKVLRPAQVIVAN